ncbi:MAG: hypothetical protein KatS3mg102_0452 [Planctomycetota bacterium]|nr:MAG: hypothetical protein KatS3mg102_0452 [Planctomycetota bacterium]
MSEGQRCEALGEELSALIDGELGPDEQARVLAHLERCSRCRQRRAALERAAALVGKLAQAEPVPDLAFLERLDARLRVELLQDGSLVPERPWRSGRHAAAGRRRGRLGGLVRLAPAAGRLAAAAVLLALAAWTVLQFGVQQPPGTSAPRGGGLAERPAAAPGPAPSPGRGAQPPLGGGEPAAVGAGVPDRAVAEVRPTGAGEPRGSLAPAAGAALAEEAGSVPAPPGTAAGTDGLLAREEEGEPAAAPAPARLAGETPRASGSGPVPAEQPERSPQQRLVRARALVRLVQASQRPESERRAALFELAQLGGEQAVAAIADVLERPERYGEALWHDALQAVRTYPERGTLLALVQAAPRDPVAVRVALERVGERELLVWLGTEVLPALDGQQARVQQLVLAEALARAGVEQAVPALARAIGERREPEVRARLVAALGRLAHPQAAAALRAALADEEPAVRVAAARALAARGRAAEDGPALLALLERERYPAVRAAAAATLGVLGGEGVPAALLRARGRDPSADVRGEALLALMRLEGLGLFAGRASGASGAASVPREALAARALAFGMPFEADGLCVLLDVSSSMTHAGKLSLARREIGGLLAALPAGSLYTVGAFGAEARLVFGSALRPASTESTQEAMRWLQRQAAGATGRTDLGRALALALAVPGVTQLLVVSDGVPTEGLEGERLLEAVRSWNWRGTVRISCAGVFAGEGSPRLDDPAVPAPPPIELLRALAAEHGGLFVRVP